ncbi:protein lin-52 homolog [Drosophila busckii]|uniref:protein lin-52 homolog n=1 Tax=Drosophila busckii TaxID=30019 RepID=UPI0014334289|nr:protein lin-52 homolog [Drosophila busckii]
MENLEPGIEMLPSEGSENTEHEAADSKPITRRDSNDAEPTEEELLSLETLRDSPLQWPERLPGMERFLTSSDTPIHTPSTHAGQSEADIAKINQLAALTPSQLIDKIKSMHDEIYQLGLRESKEMTRGKLLGIFDCIAKANP